MFLLEILQVTTLSSNVDKPLTLPLPRAPKPQRTPGSLTPGHILYLLLFVLLQDPAGTWQQPRSRGWSADPPSHILLAFVQLPVGFSPKVSNSFSGNLFHTSRQAFETLKDSTGEGKNLHSNVSAGNGKSPKWCSHTVAGQRRQEESPHVSGARQDFLSWQLQMSFQNFTSL